MPARENNAATLRADFLTYFASWTRIEPRSRTPDFASGLAARSADATWMMARAWQWGEMAGEDAASPINATITWQSAPFGTVAAKGETIADGPSLLAPLEAIVEREAMPWNLRQQVRVGQQFERFARTSLGASASDVITSYRIAFPIGMPTGGDLVATDFATRQFLELVAGRVVNGERLLAATPAELSSALLAGLAVTEAEVMAVVQRVRDWYASLYTQPPPHTPSPTWVGSQLGYQFEVAAQVGGDEAVTLAARSYRNGELDWHAFELTGQPAGAWPDIVSCVKQCRPTRVSFGGMPHRRWWAFEDSRIDFGGLDVARPNVATLALMEFTLACGSDDFFILPLGIPLGSVTKIASLIVTDVFGQTQSIPRAQSSGPTSIHRWEMFEPYDPTASTASGAALLVVPPVLSFREESAAVEEVRFLKDELANMIWAVEHRVMNGIGESIDGFDAQLERLARQSAAAGSAPTTGTSSGSGGVSSAGIALRLATTVPENWIPFMPVNSLTAIGAVATGSTSKHLFRAQMLRNDAALAPEPVQSMTRVLDIYAPSPLLWVDEEAVGREGAKVLLTRQRVRWVDGSTHVWLGRRVAIGKGEGRSGLRFDKVVQRP